MKTASTQFNASQKILPRVTNFFESSQGKILRVALGVIFLVLACLAYFMGGSFTTAAILGACGVVCFLTFAFQSVKNCCQSLKGKSESENKPKRSFASFQHQTSQQTTVASPPAQRVPSPTTKESPRSSTPKTLPSSPETTFSLQSPEPTTQQRQDVATAEGIKDWQAVVSLLNECPKLIEVVDDINALDKESQTLLHAVSRHPTLHPTSRLNLMKLLVHYKATVNARDLKERTPLHYAMDVPRKVECVEFLLAKGADLNAADGKGMTPLFYCVIYGDHEPADPNDDTLARKPLKPKEEALFAHIQAIKRHDEAHLTQARYEGCTLMQMVFKKGFSNAFKDRMKNPEEEVSLLLQTPPRPQAMSASLVLPRRPLAARQDLSASMMLGGGSGGVPTIAASQTFETMSMSSSFMEVSSRETDDEDFSDLLIEYTSGKKTVAKKDLIPKMIAKLKLDPTLVNENRGEVLEIILAESEIAFAFINDLKTFFGKVFTALTDINAHFGMTKETLLHLVQNKSIKEEDRLLLISLLLGKGAKKGVVDWQKKTPLDYAKGIENNGKCIALLDQK